MQSHKTRSKGGFCVSVPFGFDFSQNLYYLCIACVGEPGKPPPAICCAGPSKRELRVRISPCAQKHQEKGLVSDAVQAPTVFIHLLCSKKIPYFAPMRASLSPAFARMSDNGNLRILKVVPDALTNIWKVETMRKIQHIEISYNLNLCQ